MEYRSRWWGWGDPKRNYDLESHPSVVHFLKNQFNLSEIQKPKTWNLLDFSLPSHRLPQPAEQELQTTFSKDLFSLSHHDRSHHVYGKSYLDLIRIRHNKVSVAPDVIFFPKKEDDIQNIFRFAQKWKMALVPFGGGTSVVGGVEALQGNLALLGVLNMTGFNFVDQVNPQEMTVRVGAGVFGPDLEAQLNSQGYTFGHFPQSFEFSTVGGWIAAKSSGQNSLGYGGIEKNVLSLKILSPQGTWSFPNSPRHACGPDWKQFIIGSEGILGVITEAVLKVVPQPEKKKYFMLLTKSFSESQDIARKLTQASIGLAMIRASDETETRASLLMSGALDKPLVKAYLKFRNFSPDQNLSMLMVGIEGQACDIRKKMKSLRRILRDSHYLFLGSKPGTKWLKDRFFHPYMRDEFLDNGLFLETFETATSWGNLNPLLTSVHTALKTHFDKNPHLILTHISHTYPEGASLYFTVLTKQNGTHFQTQAEQWFNFKKVTSQAIINAQGVASHHHGIGRDHRNYLPWSAQQITALKVVKSNFDNLGILNPEKFFPS